MVDWTETRALAGDLSPHARQAGHQCLGADCDHPNSTHPASRDKHKCDPVTQWTGGSNESAAIVESVAGPVVGVRVRVVDASVDVHLLIDYSMELGGENALLELDDAHLGQAVSGAERAAFSNAGQLCISMERMYIPATLWDVFVDRFVEAATALKLPAVLDYSTGMGSLINEKQLQKITIMLRMHDRRAPPRSPADSHVRTSVRTSMADDPDQCPRRHGGVCGGDLRAGGVAVPGEGRGRSDRKGQR